MKKTAIAMLTLTAGILAASCQKEAEPESKSFEPMIINAVSDGVGTATKTEMAYKYDILWSEDDQIYVTDGTANDTFTLSSGEGTTKGTFTQDGEVTFNDEVQAYYPATMAQDGGLVWPATQTNNQTVPMYSTKTVSGSVEDFNFSSLGSMLQIVFTTPQADVTLKSITIKDGTETMSGPFTVDENGKANITATDKAGITLNLGDGVSVSNKIAYFNIAVPAGNYQDLTLTFTATNGTKCVMKKGKINIEHNTVGRLSLIGRTFIPIDALLGQFSVSASKKVLFSNGILYADSDNALHFESSQYNIQSRWDASYMSYFKWCSTVSAAVLDDFSYSGINLFCDENHKVSVDGSDAIYYALSSTEWQYLFDNHSSKWASVNGVNGYVIAPDGFDGIIADSYDDYTLFADNLVFLPAAGGRYWSSFMNVGENGFYWTSSAKGESGAYLVSCDNGSVASVVNEARDFGLSVRLVTDFSVPNPVYTVTFDLNGTPGTPERIHNVEHGSTIIKPSSPIKEGYDFIGWYKDVSCLDKWDFENDVVTSNIVLYAGWKKWPEGALSGKFTIAEGKQVRFSQGNLYYDGADWGFESEQYYFRTYSGKGKCDVNGFNETGTANGHWGLFGWSTSNTTYGMNTSSSSGMYSGAFIDWGNAIDKDTWHTLTKDEWVYLFETRTNAADKYGYATVGGVYGLIILPDSFTDPMKNGGSGAFVPKTTTGWNANLYTTGGNWEAMEAAGAVFLPAAGYRSGISISFVGSSGFYWSSSYNTTQGPYGVTFYSDIIDPDSSGDVSTGKSVRIVTDVLKD